MQNDGSKPAHLGHRQRIKARYLEFGIAALDDRDLMELVLTYAVPRRDVYSAASKLIDRFGCFDGVLSASDEAVRSCVKLSEHTLILIKLIGDIVRRPKTAPRFRREKLTSVLAAVEYCREQLPDTPDEAVFELLLDADDYVTGIMNVSSGTGDQAPLPVQAILDNAKSNRISRVMIAHNHPSGSSAPSSADIVATDVLSRTLSAHGVELVEHIVVGKNECTALLHHQTIKLAGGTLVPWKEA